jgi:hypothetical protein
MLLTYETYPSSLQTWINQHFIKILGIHTTTQSLDVYHNCMMKHNEQHINPSPITTASLDLTLWKPQTPQCYAPSLSGAEPLFWVAPCKVRRSLALPYVSHTLRNQSLPSLLRCSLI